MNDITARGFHEDICANPDEDAPRLIFADWLEDNGDEERAEFIRAQIERAKLPEWDVRHLRFHLREQALLKQYEQRWRASLPRIEGVVWGDFCRGFVSTASFDNFTLFANQMSKCRNAAPIDSVVLRSINMTEGSEHLRPIAGLRELALGPAMTAREIDRLADAPLLSTLRSLDIADTARAKRSFRKLFASVHLANLKRLRVPLGSLGSAGLAGLLGATLPLEELDLSLRWIFGSQHEGLSVSLGVELANWQTLASVRTLSLAGLPIGATGLRALLTSPRAGGLKALVLRHCILDASAMTAFGSAEPDLRLDHLDLSCNLLGFEGVRSLRQAECLRELKGLRLAYGRLNTKAAKDLSKALFLSSIRTLCIENNTIGTKGLKALLDVRPPELHTLTMGNNNLDDDGVKLLAESPASNVLVQVSLSYNTLRDPAATALASATQLRNLLVLRMDGHDISKETMAKLTDSALGKRLATFEAQSSEEVIPF